MKIKCPGCKKPFKTTQGKGNHVRYCKYVKDQRPELAPARPLHHPPEKSISTPVPERREPWDVNWTPAQKEAAILRGSGFEWGIGRRGGRWVPVPVLGGMGYDDAVIAADKRSAISRIKPVLTVHSQPAREQEDTTGDDLLLAMMLLDLTPKG